jgi:hypothetical protein
VLVLRRIIEQADWPISRSMVEIVSLLDKSAVCILFLSSIHGCACLVGGWTIWPGEPASVVAWGK